MHISLTPDLDLQLSEFVKLREKGTDKSKVLRYALETLFSLEDLNPLKQAALKYSLERKFSVPKNIPLKSFYLFLYLLSKNYPEESSKDFWTEVIYISSLDKSHIDVFQEVKDEYKIFFENKSKNTNGKVNLHGKRQIPRDR